MNGRRSRSVKLVSSDLKHIELDIEDDSGMSSSAANLLYCCVAKDRNILYSYNTMDRDENLESAAAFCLENASSYHRWRCHTVGSRTLGYLMADGYTYLVIVDPSVGTSVIVQFLENVREVFENANKSRFHDLLLPIIKRLAAALEKMPRSSFLAEESSGGPSSTDGLTVSSAAPLLGKSRSKPDRKKRKEKEVVAVDVNGDLIRTDICVQAADGGGMSIDRSAADISARQQQLARRSWCRHAKLIIAIDIVICVVLFGAWLAVCRGFRCVSRK